MKAVKQPIIAKTFNSAELNIGYTPPNKNTPAATIVAACISADTDVGPSIASGSQVCSGNCADLAATPSNIPMKAIHCHTTGMLPVGDNQILLLLTDCATKPPSPNKRSISKV